MIVMKIPLHYQMSEYDCGPTSVLNALNFLFEREELPPVLIRNIMLYCLDCYDACGEAGKSGTSRSAMMFLSNWIEGFGQTGRLAISSSYVAGNKVYMGPGSEIVRALKQGGAVVVRIFLDEWHYVLLTGIREDNSLLAFDPYLDDSILNDHPEVQAIDCQPYLYNRIIPADNFNVEIESLYAFGPKAVREAVIIYNNHTKKNIVEEQIEYII